MGRAERIRLAVVWGIVGILVSGCVPFWKRDGRPTGRPLDSEVETSWCYRTLAEVECYPSPQKDAASRLIGVQPKDKTPKTIDKYKQDYGASAQ